ncbi:MAG: glycoside hydrolase family 78 protein, partial [Candidatus Hydrogenedentes bacterium]|nr:glycoside hydrolase family 78 protein [Candidatus Hydrogenedentota bacterium]
SVGFDDSHWYSAQVSDKPGLGIMEAQPIPPIRVGKRYFSKEVRRLENGAYLIDFGQNLTGRIYLKVRNCKGKKVQVRYGELLYPDGKLNPMTSVCGQIKGHTIPGLGDNFTAEQKDVFSLVSDRERVLTTNFTYHGFRYAEISGINDFSNVTDIFAERLHTAVQPVGSFQCSEDLLNRIQKMCVETLISNLHSVQTDCPHREKFGYGGDIVASSEFAMFNFDMWAFYRKVVKDFSDEVRPNGGFTETAPFVGIDDFGFGDGSGPLAWGSVHPLLLWQLYQYYGDRLIVEEEYEKAKQWLELLEKSAKDGIQTQCIGDHESIAEKQVEVSATAYYYLNAKIISILANILNKSDDGEKYKKLSEYIARKFKEKYVDENGKVGIGTQANQCLFLAFGMPSYEEKLKAEKVLIEDVMRSSGRLTTGIFGTKYLMRMLCEAGTPELAYGIVASREFPGWGYMLEKGATTLWEHWEFSDNVFSHNHPMFGSVSEWFYKDLGGISPDEGAYGFDRIVIKPEFSLPLTSVNCRYNSVRGEIISNWTKKENIVRWQLKTPPNTSGRVVLHNIEYVELENLPIEEHTEVRVLNREPSKLEFFIENGSFDFQVRLRAN